MKMKPLLAIFLMLVFSVAAIAHDGDFSEAKQLVENEVPCSELTDAQLESIGDYLMEQMHPGEAHELMDEMMGGEGSESLKLMHINMAKHLYCGDASAMQGGMMGMMMGSGYGMMGYNGGMMNMMGNYAGNYGYGMMGSSNLFGASLLWLLFAAIGAFVFGIIFWWTYNMIVKNKGKKK